MNYRELGRTGLKVSEVAFGCGNLGGLFVRGAYDEQQHATTRALELGINYFDTAPGYGNGRSEMNLGRVLAELRPDVSVATKVRLGQDDLGDIKSAVQRSVESSLRRLNRDSVDVLQLHTQISPRRGGSGWLVRISVEDVLGEAGVADAFDAVRSQGLVRFTGFTGLGDTGALHQVVRSGRFDLIQAYYNILNPSAGLPVPQGFVGQDFDRIIDAAAEEGMGVVVIRVLAGGALGGESARTGYAAASVGAAIVPGSDYMNDEARAEKLAEMIGSDTGDLPQTAVRFALMQPRISTVLVGFSDEEQLEKAAGCSRAPSLPEPIVNALPRLWATDSTG
jgi:aryl-alcohol dehydrogenase-like predicted oxidoreductase